VRAPAKILLCQVSYNLLPPAASAPQAVSITRKTSAVMAGGDDAPKRGVDMKQYGYKATSNLVLQQDRPTRKRRLASGADEVAALRVGDLGGAMGDRARSAPEKRETAPSRKKRAADGNADDVEDVVVRRSSTRRKLGHGALKDVLAAAEELDLDEREVRYVPKTQVSQMAFEGLLAFVLAKLGNQPRDVLLDAAEDALAALKDQSQREIDRKSTIQRILSVKLSDDEFARLSTFGRQIKDYGDDSAKSGADGASTDDTIADGGDGDMIDEDQGVAVVFDDEDDLDDQAVSGLGLGAGDDAQYVDHVVEPDDASSDDGDRDAGPAGVAGVVDGDNGDDNSDRAGDNGVMSREGGRDPGDDSAVVSSGAVNMFDDDERFLRPALAVTEKISRAELDAHSIDGFWLQRQLSHHYPDAQACQDLAEKVFEILSSRGGDRNRENRLVMLLDYDKFDLIKMMLQQRVAIVFCIRRARAHSDEERAAIEREMSDDPQGVKILAALHGAKPDAQPVKRRPRRASLPPTAPLPEAPFAAKRALHASMRGSIGHLKLRKLDLEDLAFAQGSHLMSVKECRLPGSVHHVHKDYEEWHVPATRAKELPATASLVSVSSLPKWAHPVFPNTKDFNRVQSQVYACAFESDENMLLCAPTGAGKTNVAVLTILRAVHNSMTPSGVADLDSFKVVYVAPMKALVSEVVANLGGRLEALGLSVRELTGDVNMTRKEIDETHVIVTTPEKWDIITRKAGERAFTSLVRLLIVDEIHLLHDERGPVLEAIIARTVRSVESTSITTRIVGLSATLPNYRDVAAFMRVNVDSGLFHFDASYRPCPLQQCYIGITAKKALRRAQLMNELTYDKVKSQVAAGNQVIVFVHSRKDTGIAARYIVEKAIDEEVIDQFMLPGTGSHEIVKSEMGAVQGRELAALLENGVAIHHAGMTRGDRSLVEALFEAGHVKVLVSTATLAWGVNLPAHAVIIRGTQVYSPERGRWVELSPMDVMQMMGRAGRPQFDTQGEGFIITTKSEVLFYLSVLNQQLPIESQLVARLADMINAEVAIGTISSVVEGSIWLGYTYLYVRMLRNPSLYGIPAEDMESDPMLERRRMELMHAACTLLDRGGLLRYDRRSGQVLGTDLGRVAADFYVGFQTMSVYSQHLKPTLTDIDLLRVFALSVEFKHMRVRDEEKLELVRLADRVPIPVKESLDEPSAKVNILLQAYVSNLKLDGLALASDMVYVTQSAGRLCRSLFHIVLGRRWAGLVDRCLNLCKMVSKRQWTSQTPLRQFLPSVSDDILRKIERKDVEFEHYYELTAAEVGEMLRNPRLGKTVHRLVHALPRMELDVTRVQPLTRSLLRVELTLTPDFRFDTAVHGFGEAFWILVEDADSERLLHVESFYLHGSLAGDEEHMLTLTLPISSPMPPQYFVRCVSDRWITSDTVVPVSLRELILPSKFPPHTDLLDLQPLSVRSAFSLPSTSEVRKDDDQTTDTDGVLDLEVYVNSLGGLRAMFVTRFKNFNPIQTQSFAALFRSDENCVIAAPSGSGRMVCAELALGRLYARQPTGVAIFIVGRGPIAMKRRFSELRDGLGRSLAVEVGELTGESGADIALLRKPRSLVLSSPEKWDMLSRRWQHKKEGRAISNISLIVLESAHLIGADPVRGTTLEVIGSRMRYIAAQSADDLKPPCRIVATLDAVSNARDIGHWLGAPLANVLTFHPSVRDIPIDIHVEPAIFRAGGGVAATGAALARPVYRAIRKYSATIAAPVVVFVASRRLSRALALEIVNMTTGEGEADQFVNASGADMAALLSNVRLETLRECLSKGVGYVHDALSDDDRQVVEQLFGTGAIKVLVCTSEYAWECPAARGQLVIIAGTAAEEAGGYALGRAEYPLFEISHMIGRAGRAQVDTSGACVIVTEPSLRDYYLKLSREPLPVESHLGDVLADQLNAEVASRVIQTKQQAVDYLTWTLFYRRLPLNPNYYNMAGNSRSFIQDHLSDLVENALSDLEASKCVAVEGDEFMDLGSLNLGMIASHYYIAHSTVELFASSITARTKIRGLLDIVSSASEFDRLPVRIGEEFALRKLAARVPVPLSPSSDATSATSFSDPHIKAHLLLQSHLSRLPLAGDLADDREYVVGEVVRLVRALVDVISSAGWLKPAIKAMEMCQMFVQGMWDSDPSILQLPHIGAGIVKILKDKFDVDSVDQLSSMEDDDRNEALVGLSRAQLSDVARTCNQFPAIREIAATLVDSEVTIGDRTVVHVVLEREDDEAEGDGDSNGAKGKATVPVASAPRYPKRKEEGWWLVVGDPASNTLLSLKYVSFAKKSKVKLEISAPTTPGEYKLELYLISDAYVADSDQLDEFVLNVVGDKLVTGRADDERDSAIEERGEDEAAE
jgi:pre-mRNA-splicing helicase BRR2